MTAPVDDKRLHIFTPAPTRITKTRRRSHLPFDTGDDQPGTYSVYTWDHENDDWEPYREGLSLMALRGVIRNLENTSWSEASYYVDKIHT